jgi:hypothetical protein
MTFLPIVGRELRVAARRRATYWVRASAALAAIIVGGFVFLVTLSQPPKMFGQALFQTLAWFSIPYCLFAGVRLTADCLSAEKREGTLGLLFLTDLKGYDVVLGKLVATSVGGFYGLVAIFPVLAVPLLMGGVTHAEFWRMALALANTFVFGLGIGLFVSAVSDSPRKATAGTLVLILVFAAALPLCVICIPYLTRWRGFENLVLLTCPISSFARSFEQEYLSGDMPNFFGVNYYWWSLGVIHVMTWGFLLLACLITPRSWQDRPSGALWTRWRQQWHRWNYGDAGERNTYRARLLDVNAFYWLAARARLKPVFVWGMLAVAACLWFWGWAEQRSDWLNLAVYFITALVLNTALKVWVASEAAHRLGEDRRIGSLELVLSTPLSVGDILRGQMLALRRQFLWPAAAVMLVEAAFLLAAMHDTKSGFGSSSDEQSWLAMWVAGMAMLVTDLWALSWVGMWVSLTAKNPVRATGNALARVLVLPWVVFFVITIIWGNLIGLMSRWEPGVGVLVGLWFGLGLIADLFFGLRARARLQTMFREVATQRQPGRRWSLARLFRRGTTAALDGPPVVAS